MRDKELYFGYASDLRRRQAEHMKGNVESTCARRPLRLIYYEAYSAKQDARERERQIKRRAKAHVSLKRRLRASLSARLE